MSHMKRFLENVNEEIAFLKRGIEAYRAAYHRVSDATYSGLPDACRVNSWEKEAKERETQSDPTLLINILRNDE